MTEYGMGDEATIDEVIEDVDTDKVISFFYSSSLFYLFVLHIIFFQISMVFDLGIYQI